MVSGIKQQLGKGQEDFSLCTGKLSVLRIHLILMLIRIRILDPHWKNVDPDPDHFFKNYLFFFNKKMIFKFFFAYFYYKTRWPIRKEKIFKSSDLGFRSKKVFFSSVFGWFFTPWIRIPILSTGKYMLGLLALRIGQIINNQNKKSFKFTDKNKQFRERNGLFLNFMK